MPDSTQLRFSRIDVNPFEKGLSHLKRPHGTAPVQAVARDLAFQPSAPHSESTPDGNRIEKKANRRGHAQKYDLPRNTDHAVLVGRSAPRQPPTPSFETLDNKPLKPQRVKKTSIELPTQRQRFRGIFKTPLSVVIFAPFRASTRRAAVLAQAEPRRPAHRQRELTWFARSKEAYQRGRR